MVNQTLQQFRTFSSVVEIPATNKEVFDQDEYVDHGAGVFTSSVIEWLEEIVGPGGWDDLPYEEPDLSFQWWCVYGGRFGPAPYYEFYFVEDSAGLLFKLTFGGT